MHQLQRSWVRSQHPSAQWNLRGGKWSSAEWSTKNIKNPLKKIFEKKLFYTHSQTLRQGPSYPKPVWISARATLPPARTGTRPRRCVAGRPAWLPPLPAAPPSGRVGKNPGLKKKPAQWIFFFFFYIPYIYIYICPEERVFRVSSVSRILLGASRL